MSDQRIVTKSSKFRGAAEHIDPARLKRPSKPSVFVASSSEGLIFAEVLQAQLGDHYNSHLWTYDIFRPGSYPLETLEEQLEQRHYAIIVATPDDDLIKRGNESKAIRDNLLIEYGLFVGKLGRKRTFLLMPANSDLGMPSDLTGLTTVRYDSVKASGELRDKLAAMQRPILQLRDAIDSDWGRRYAHAEDENRRIQASARYVAIRRLHGVIVQLRDLLLGVPRNMLGALGNKVSFEQVKRDGAEKVQRLYEQWEQDARLLNVCSEFRLLANATSEAVLELPYPHEVLVTKTDVQDGFVMLSEKVLGAVLSGQSGFDAAKSRTVEEVETRINLLQRKYAEWWNKHSAEIQNRTNEMQDALMQASIDLSGEAYGA